jgi:hypothetical protein
VTVEIVRVPAEAARVCRGRESVKRPEECVEAVRVCGGRESVVEAVKSVGDVLMLEEQGS